MESQEQLLQPIDLNLYLLLKDKRKIILLKPNIENIGSLKKIEQFSANLAKFLQIPLKEKLFHSFSPYLDNKQYCCFWKNKKN
jgi:hypothetical protein